MAKRSVPARIGKSLTLEERQNVAQRMLTELKKITGGHSLIQDELDADFTKLVIEKLDGVPDILPPTR